MPGSFGNHVEKLISLAREWPTATCNASRFNELAKQSKMYNERVVRRRARSISKEDPRYTSRTKGVPFPPRHQSIPTHHPTCMEARPNWTLSIRLEFTLLWLEDRRFARGGKLRATYRGLGLRQGHCHLAHPDCKTELSRRIILADSGNDRTVQRTLVAE